MSKPLLAAQTLQAYPQLLDLMVRLIESQSGKAIAEGEAWRNDAQTLARKLFHHLVSMRVLANGGAIAQPKGSSPAIPYVDHGSINVLAGAALETYLVWYYLYGNPADPAQGRFRHMTWELGGLMDRQSLYPMSEAAVRQLAIDRTLIDKLKAELVQCPLMANFSPKQQARLLNGDWKTAMGTQDLAVGAGFHGVYFRDIYSHLCGYAHASYISALQVRDAQTFYDQEGLALPMLTLGLVIMGHFALAYAKQFPSAQAVLEEQPTAHRLAARWAMTAEDLQPIYLRDPKAP